jgi:E1A/CREB-binding protein
MKRRGFHTAHIWSCPPSKGDDYILYCHPNDQKTPKTDKLQKWYADMLDDAKERGIVEEVTDLHTEFLVDPSYDATVLPYFEGDYWTTEAEVIIKALGPGPYEPKVEEVDISGNTITPSNSSALHQEDGSAPLSESDSKKSKRKSKSSSQRPTRSGKSIGPSGSPIRSDRDPVMAKLASIIEPMKNTFFVARLRSREYAEQCIVTRQREIAAELEEKQNSNKITDTSTVQPGVETTTAKTASFSDVQQTEAAPSSSTFEIMPTNSLSAQTDSESNQPSDINGIAETKIDTSEQEVNITESKEPEISKSETAMKVEESESIVKVAENVVVTEGKISESQVETKSAEDTENETTTGSFEDKLDLKDDTEDADDVQESEHWDTRQSFLNLCQGNHYQFDQLRRAKFSSLLVLYLMHNPDAPKFLSVCHLCHHEINTGMRRRCEQCDIDFCQNCYQVNGGNRIHHHQLRGIPVTGNAPPVQITAQERLARKIRLKEHLQLLVHAAYCDDETTCINKRNCTNIKVIQTNPVIQYFRFNNSIFLCCRIFSHIFVTVLRLIKDVITVKKSNC